MPLRAACWVGAGHPTFAAIVNVLVSITVHFIPFHCDRPRIFLSPPPTLTSPSGPRAPDACREHSIAYAFAFALTSTPSLFLRLRPSTFDLVHLEAACRTLRATEVRGRPSASSPFVSVRLSSAQLTRRQPADRLGGFIHSFIHPSIQPVSSFISYLHTAILAAAFTGKRVSEALTTRPRPPNYARTHTLPKPASQPTSDPHPASETHPTPPPPGVYSCVRVRSQPASVAEGRYNQEGAIEAEQEGRRE